MFIDIVDLFDELTHIVAALDACGVEYAVCGALALAIHGVPRATKDIDMLVQAHALERLRPAVAGCGYTIEALPMTFSTSGITVHRFTKLDGGEAMMLDVLIADGPLGSVWATRQQLAFSAGSIGVVSRAGLITLKLAAGRPQDLADIARLQEVEE